MFIIYDNWKLESEVPGYFGCNKGFSYCVMAEVVFNKHIFHVDVLQRDDCDDESINRWRRFITSDTKIVLDLISDNKFDECMVSFVSRRCDNEDGEYHVSSIMEIYGAKDSYDQDAYICVCKNGVRYIDSLVAEDERELHDITRLYYSAGDT